MENQIIGNILLVVLFLMCSIIWGTWLYYITGDKDAGND